MFVGDFYSMKISGRRGRRSGCGLFRGGGCGRARRTGGGRDGFVFLFTRGEQRDRGEKADHQREKDEEHLRHPGRHAPRRETPACSHVRSVR